MNYFYRTPNDGYLLSTENYPNGNMVGYTSQLIFLTPRSMMNQALMLGLQDCGAGSGVVTRHPGKIENTSVDDYLALACVYPFANIVLSKAHRNFGFIDLNFPQVSVNSFMFRFQGFWQHLKVCAKAVVGPLGRAIWAISIVLAARKPFDNIDSWVESHLMVLAKERYGYNSFIGDLAVKYWRKKKGNVKTSDLYAKYIGVTDHPLVWAWKPYD